MKNFFAVIFIMITQLSYANESNLRISYYAYTQHLTVKNQNDSHPMIQLEFDRKYVIGGFVNSGNKWSWYVARRWQAESGLKPYVELGAMSGYIPNRLIKSIRYGIEINPNIDLVVLPAIVDTYKIQNPAAVVGIVLKF